MVLGREVGSGTCARSSPLSVCLVARVFLRRAAESLLALSPRRGACHPQSPFCGDGWSGLCPGAPPQHRRALADGCLPHLAASTGSGAEARQRLSNEAI